VTDSKLLLVSNAMPVAELAETLLKMDVLFALMDTLMLKTTHTPCQNVKNATPVVLHAVDQQLTVLEDVLTTRTTQTKALIVEVAVKQLKELEDLEIYFRIIIRLT
jgi:hypothetical protein